MRTRKTLFSVLLLSLITPLTFLQALDNPVQKGVLDLTKNPIYNRVVFLEGEWEFYWRQLLVPQDPRTTGRDTHPPVPFSPDYWRVPQIWNGYPGIAGHVENPSTAEKNQTVGGQGFASYRLVVESPTNLYAGLKIPDMATAYRVYWNGALIARSGNVGTDSSSHVPQYYLSLEPIQILEGKNELIIHVSNFSHYKGGIWEKIQMGDWDKIRQTYLTDLATELFLAGAILIMSIYHFGIFLLRRKEKTALFFALFCLFITIRILTVGERFLFILMPEIPWALGMNLEYNSYYFSPIFFLLFVNAAYPSYIHRRILEFSIGFTVLFSVIILILPSTIYPLINTYFHLGTLVMIVTGSYAVLRAFIAREEGARAFTLGLIPIVIATINDILFSMHLIQTFQMISIGLFLFIFSQSFLLSIKFSRAFREAENYSDRLISLDRLKDEFLANTSRELQSPLNGIIGVAESMIDGSTGKLNLEQHKNLSMVVSSGKRLASIINDILDFSRMKNKDIALQRKPVNLESIVNLVLTTMRPSILSKHLGVQNDIPFDFPPIYADEDRLQQILYSLIGNAVKFTETGSITISATVDNRSAIVCIADTGIGIPPERVPDIFLSFDELQNKASGRSTGLGLAITKQLIELQDGTIWVEPNDSTGSRFFFTLPLAETRDQIEILTPNSQPEVQALIPYTRNEGTHEIESIILIVDDEAINRQVLNNILAHKNYLILEASGGREALRMIEEDVKPDLVILDAMMPIMNGYETCAEIRKKHNIQDLPILLLTSKHQIQDVVVGLEAGANDYVSKPFDKRELITRVRNLLTVKKAIREQSKYTSYQNEMQIAQNLQASILPENPPDFAGVHFAFDYTPMEQVGGDFFDFHIIDKNRVGIIIADVSGHGVPAALVASMLKIASTTQFEKSSNPAEYLENINRTLHGKTKKSFITASYVEIDIAKKKLLHARAGHPPMLFLDKNSEESYQSLPTGMMIGWFEEAKYKIDSLPLFGAKRIALYTDGIIEARNAKGEMYSTERFVEILKKTKTWDTGSAMAYIKEDIYRWTNTKNLEDDLTLILVDIDIDQISQKPG